MTQILTSTRPDAAGPQPTARRLTDLPVLLALAAILCGALTAGLLLAARPPAEGSAEAGFARDMAAHHQQAVGMATLERDRTRDSQLRAVAVDIVATQQAQIGQFRGWLDAWGLPPTSTDLAMTWMGHPTPEASMPGLASPAQLRQYAAISDPTQQDVQFLRLMIPHHQGGVAMAEAILEQTGRGEVRRTAEQIIAAQQAKIDWMQGELRRRGQPSVSATVTMPPGERGHGNGGFTAGLTASGWDVARVVPLTLALLAATWLAVDILRRRAVPRSDGSRAGPSSSVAWLLAVVGLAASGAIHFGLAPEHFAEATAYGAFFVAAAVAAAILAGAVLADPERHLSLAGALLLAGLIVVYVVFRLVPPPGADNPERFDLVGLATQAIQVAALGGCLVLARRSRRASHVGRAT